MQEKDEISNGQNKTIQNLLFDFISKYITLTDEEWNACVALDIFHTEMELTFICKY